MLGPCLVMQSFVSFRVLQSSRWGSESWLLYFFFFLILCSCNVFLPLPPGALGWSAVCDCGSSWSYSLTFRLSENESGHNDEVDPLYI